MASCASHKPFDSFYNDHKKEVKLAVTVPKYIANVFIPKEEKPTVRRFTKGMKRIKVLVDEEYGTQLTRDFDSFIKAEGYNPYLYINTKGERIQLLVSEDENSINEVVIRSESEDMTVILALQGQMQKDRFESLLSED